MERICLFKRSGKNPDGILKKETQQLNPARTSDKRLGLLGQ